MPFASAVADAPPTTEAAAEHIEWQSQWFPLCRRAAAARQADALRLLDVSLVAWESVRLARRGGPLPAPRRAARAAARSQRDALVQLPRQFADGDAPSYVPTGGCGARLRAHPSQVCSTAALGVAEGGGERLGRGARGVAKPLPVDHLPAPDCVVTDWTVNRVPIPWASLLENTLDDAHGVHAHHGLAGLDRALARPASQTRSGESGAGESFAAWVNVSGPLIASDLAGRVDADSVESTWVNSYRFLAPHRTTVRFGPAYRAEGFLVPTAADETLLVSAAFSVPGPGLGGNLLKAAQRANPFLTAILHRTGVKIVCQDAVLAEADGLDDLRGERWTGERTSGGLTASDGAVVRLRKWLRRSGGPPLKPTEKSDVRRWRARPPLGVGDAHQGLPDVPPRPTTPRRRQGAARRLGRRRRERPARRRGHAADDVGDLAAHRPLVRVRGSLTATRARSLGEACPCGAPTRRPCSLACMRAAGDGACKFW